MSSVKELSFTIIDEKSSWEKNGQESIELKSLFLKWYVKVSALPILVLELLKTMQWHE